MSIAAPGMMPAAEADPLLGRVINDRYRIIEQIGQGGMGRVYRALQAPLDRVKFFTHVESGEENITNAGTFMGSPHYIAPEQARNQSPDQRCDIYSLGVLLYHMLVGRVPFTASAPVDIILKHLHEAPVPLNQARHDLAIVPMLEAIVLRCLAKTREERYQSMDELLAQLKIVRTQLTGAT